MTEFQINEAIGYITRAEFDLGTLSDGQRRDLLKDNTDMDSDLIADIVAHLREKI